MAFAMARKGFRAHAQQQATSAAVGSLPSAAVEPDPIPKNAQKRIDDALAALSVTFDGAHESLLAALCDSPLLLGVFPRPELGASLESQTRRALDELRLEVCAAFRALFDADLEGFRKELKSVRNWSQVKLETQRIAAAVQLRNSVAALKNATPSGQLEVDRQQLRERNAAVEAELATLRDEIEGPWVELGDDEASDADDSDEEVVGGINGGGKRGFRRDAERGLRARAHCTDQVQAKLDAAEDEIESAHAALREVAGELETTHGHNMKLKKQLEEEEARRKQDDEERRQQQQQQQQQQRMRASRRPSVSGELEAEISALGGRARSMQRRSGELEVTNQYLKSEMERLRSEVEAGRSRLEKYALMGDLDVMAAEHKEMLKEVERLRVSQKSAEDALGQVMEALRAADERTSALEEDRRRWDVQRGNMERELEESSGLRARSERAEARLEEMQEQLDGATARLKAMVHDTSSRGDGGASRAKIEAIREQYMIERQQLVNSALDALQQLRSHLTVTLTGMQSAGRPPTAFDAGAFPFAFPSGPPSVGSVGAGGGMPTPLSESFTYSKRRHRWGVRTKGHPFGTLIVKLEPPPPAGPSNVLSPCPPSPPASPRGAAVKGVEGLGRSVGACAMPMGTSGGAVGGSHVFSSGAGPRPSSTVVVPAEFRDLRVATASPKPSVGAGSSNGALGLLTGEVTSGSPKRQRGTQPLPHAPRQQHAAPHSTVAASGEGRLLPVPPLVTVAPSCNLGGSGMIDVPPVPSHSPLTISLPPRRAPSAKQKRSGTSVPTSNPTTRSASCSSPLQSRAAARVGDGNAHDSRGADDDGVVAEDGGDGGAGTGDACGKGAEEGAGDADGSGGAAGGAAGGADCGGGEVGGNGDGNGGCNGRGDGGVRRPRTRSISPPNTPAGVAAVAAAEAAAKAIATALGEADGDGSVAAGEPESVCESCSMAASTATANRPLSAKLVSIRPPSASVLHRGSHYAAKVAAQLGSSVRLPSAPPPTPLLSIASSAGSGSERMRAGAGCVHMDGSQSARATLAAAPMRNSSNSRPASAAQVSSRALSRAARAPPGPLRSSSVTAEAAMEVDAEGNAEFGIVPLAQRRVDDRGLAALSTMGLGSVGYR